MTAAVGGKVGVAVGADVLVFTNNVTNTAGGTAEDGGAEAPAKE